MAVKIYSLFQVIYVDILSNNLFSQAWSALAKSLIFSAQALAQYYDLPHHIYYFLTGNEVKLLESLRYHNTLQIDTYIYFKCSASIAENLQAMIKCHLQRERGATPHQLPGLWAMHQSSVFPLTALWFFICYYYYFIVADFNIFIFIFSYACLLFSKICPSGRKKCFKTYWRATGQIQLRCTLGFQ